MYNSIREIPRFTEAQYRCDVPLDSLGWMVDKWIREYGLELNPDFQRGHVWSEAQQMAYCEYFLRGGTSGREVYFNAPFWMSRRFHGERRMVLVDGLQRITALLKMLRNNIAVFGRTLMEYPDHELALRDFRNSLSFNVADLPTRADVLQWYLDLNSGVAHTDKELSRIKGLLGEELYKEQAEITKRMMK